jgi:uncharacterized protein (DUF1697 family)
MALVALLKGVNVGGHRRFRPTELAARLKDFDVVNIGAAGTFVVRRPVSRTELADQIRRRLPFDAHIALCDDVEVLDLLSLDPFAGEVTRSGTVRFVSVLSRPSGARPSFPVALPPRGRWLVKVLGRHGPFVIGLYRRHMRTIGWLESLDDVFGVPVTTRQWSTLGKIGRVLRGDGS